MVFYTLIDTEGKGQGEFIRLIFAQAQLQYDDKKLNNEQAKQYKTGSPTGGLPVLDSAGSQIGETNVIARYLGSLYHLYGANAIERARIDQVLEQVLRLTDYFHGSYIPKEALRDASMAANFEKLREHGVNKAPEILTHLETQLNNNGGNFFAGSSLSIADISAYYFLKFVSEHDSAFAAIYAKHSALNRHAQQVAQSPRIAAYLSK